jgi:hypothetical protein
MAQPATTVGDIYTVIDTSFIPNGMKKTLKFQVQSLPTENKRLHIENLMTAVARLATIHFNKKMGVKDSVPVYFGNEDSSSDTDDASDESGATDYSMIRGLMGPNPAVSAPTKPIPAPVIAAVPAVSAPTKPISAPVAPVIAAVPVPAAPIKPIPAPVIAAVPAPAVPIPTPAPDDASSDDDENCYDDESLSILLLLEDLQRDVDGRSPGGFLEAASSLLSNRLLELLPIQGETDFRARVSKTRVASRWITHLLASVDVLMDQGISSIRPARGDAIKMIDEQFRNDCILSMNPAYPTGAALAFVVIFFTLYETGSEIVFSECSGDMGQVIKHHWTAVVDRLEGKKVLGTDYLFGEYARYLSAICFQDGFTSEHVKDLQIPGKFWGFPKPAATAAKRKPAGPAPTPTKPTKMPTTINETD